MGQGDCTRTKKQKPPLTLYRNSKPHAKTLIWLFLKGIQTQGKEGYKPGVAIGGKKHYGCTPHNLKTWYSSSKTFYNASKVCMLPLLLLLIITPDWTSRVTLNKLVHHGLGSSKIHSTVHCELVVPTKQLTCFSFIPYCSYTFQDRLSDRCWLNNPRWSYYGRTRRSRNQS